MTEECKKKIKLFTYILLIALQFDSEVIAGDKSVNVTVEGTIHASVCTINNNQTMNVEFGVVRIDNLSSTSANVPITISCDSNPTGAVSLEIKGTSSSFNADVLASNKQGLGVKLNFESSTASSAIELNKFHDVKKMFGLASYTGTFNIKAKLVTDGISELSGGDFTSSATLVVQVS